MIFLPSYELGGVAALVRQRGPHLAGPSDTGQIGADDRGVEMLCVMASSGPCPLFSLDLAETA
jgi:hypothetical protein